MSTDGPAAHDPQLGGGGGAAETSSGRAPELPVGYQRFGPWLLGALAAALVAHYATAIFTENINWDEFAFLQRAARTAETGALQGGGRPGLAVFPILPLVAGCEDAIRTVRAGRLLWVPVTLSFIAGLFLFLANVLRGLRSTHWHDAALGTALLVLVPVFLRWSLQVRTDQWALACGVWGGVALLASRRRVSWALAAGALFGAGFLFTQKLVYSAALVGLLAAGRQLLDGDFHLGRELRRLSLLAAGAFVVAAGFWALVPLYFEPARTTTLGGGLDVFAGYRAALGLRVYRGMLPTLAPHLIMGVLLVPATVAVALGKVRGRGEIALAWGALGLGLAVMFFHAGAFPYFWMTLGIFPAAAAALALGPIRELFTTPALGRVFLAALWVALLLPSTAAAVSLQQDTQAIQRQALAFVERNFEPTDQGFHPEGALFCRRDAEPFPVFFDRRILQTFRGDGGRQAAADFIQEFRSRPVRFIMTSYRLAHFPRSVIEFWNQHYVLYGPAVMVPGVAVPGPDETLVMRVLVAGEYRWQDLSSPPGARVMVADQILSSGQSVRLDRGAFQVQLLGQAGPGVLALALEDHFELRLEPFYSHAVMREFAGRPASDES